jgi:hypothetical protein
VGDQGQNVSSVNITVTVACMAQSYDLNSDNGATNLAIKALQSKAPQMLTAAGVATPAKYVQVGKINTQATSGPVTAKNVSISVATQGVWAYQFTDTDKNAIISAIKGKSKNQAQSILNGQPGVANAVLDSGNSLPTDPNQITLNIQAVSGPSGTPSGVTPGTGTVGPIGTAGAGNGNGNGNGTVPPVTTATSGDQTTPTPTSDNMGGS